MRREATGKPIFLTYSVASYRLPDALLVQLPLEEFDGDPVELFGMFGLRVQPATGHCVELGARRHVKRDESLLDRQNFILFPGDKQHGTVILAKSGRRFGTS